MRSCIHVDECVVELSDSDAVSSSPLVVRFYGICTKDPAVASIVVEFCSLGDLRTYLDSDVLLGDEQRFAILMDIAQVQCPPLLASVSLNRSHF